jgi:TetR/AcrR family transcriptional regulator, regulator of cefoperazone and chloramphenicol sensitivity
MKTPRKDAEQTRQSLLSAGRELFAEKGYRSTTIAEICERAGANVAAVNYHFGDKATLYSESWRYAFLKAMEAHPPDGGVRHDAPPEERLRGQISSLLGRISDKDNKQFFIILKELANPTGLLDEVMRDEVDSENKRLEAVIRELLGDQAPDMQVQFFIISTITQCVNMIVAETSREKEKQNSFCLPKIGDMEAYIDHVASLVLAGIYAARKRGGNPGGGARSGQGEGHE